MNGYSIGTGNLNSIIVNVIADTGITLIYLPEQIVDAYYASVSDAVKIPTGPTYFFPCGTALPSITFGIGNYYAIVRGSFIEIPSIEQDQSSTFHQIFRYMPRITLTLVFFFSLRWRHSAG